MGKNLFKDTVTTPMYVCVSAFFLDFGQVFIAHAKRSRDGQINPKSMHDLINI